MVLKMKMTKTVPLFLAAVLMPYASIAIEDCGTSVTECRMKQQIEDLQQQNQAQQGQIEKLQAAMSLVLQKMDAISVSSDGNVGIGTTAPGAKLEVNGTMKFTGGSGPMCIFANACPNGWVDKGGGGYIRENSGSCPYSPGGAFNQDWTWCHPRICCNQ
jgi:uncharacterized coiled-coil protein SlyX